MNDLDSKIEETEKAIKELEIRKEKKLKLAQLQLKYNELTYPEKHPFRHKFKMIFRTLRKESGNLMKKAQEQNKKNPWE